MKFLVLIAALALPAAALAADTVSVESKVLVERVVVTSDGKSKTVREEPRLVTPGQKLAFVLEYKNKGASAASDFVVTNPIPSTVEFIALESPGGVVSVDGGKSWGELATLKVKGANGVLRSAGPADVTAVRWVMAKPIPAGASGNLSFHGVVR